MDELHINWLEKHCKCMKCENKCMVTHISSIDGKVEHNKPFCTKYAVDISTDVEMLCDHIKHLTRLLIKSETVFDKLSTSATQADYNKGKVNQKVHDFIHCVRMQSEEMKEEINKREKFE